MPKLALFILLSCATILELVESGGHEHGHHHHVIIHVPYKIKTIKHTHTITKHIHHKDGGDNYEVLGYTVGKPLDLGGHGGYDFGGQDFGGHDFGGQDFGSHDWSGGGGGGGGVSHDWSGGGAVGGGGSGGNHDWSGGGISEDLKGYEGNFDGGHIGGYETSEGEAGLGAESSPVVMTITRT